MPETSMFPIYNLIPQKQQTSLYNHVYINHTQVSVIFIRVSFTIVLYNHEELCINPGKLKT